MGLIYSSNAVLPSKGTESNAIQKTPFMEPKTRLNICFFI